MVLLERGRKVKKWLNVVDCSLDAKIIKPPFVVNMPLSTAPKCQAQKCVCNIVAVGSRIVES